MRAKREHEAKLAKAKTDEELKELRELEIVNRRTLKLTEKVQQLRQLSKLNDERFLDSKLLNGNSSCEIDDPDNLQSIENEITSLTSLYIYI